MYITKIWCCFMSLCLCALQPKKKVLLRQKLRSKTLNCSKSQHVQTVGNIEQDASPQFIDSVRQTSRHRFLQQRAPEVCFLILVSAAFYLFFLDHFWKNYYQWFYSQKHCQSVFLMSKHKTTGGGNVERRSFFAGFILFTIGWFQETSLVLLENNPNLWPSREITSTYLQVFWEADLGWMLQRLNQQGALSSGGKPRPVWAGNLTGLKIQICMRRGNTKHQKTNQTTHRKAAVELKEKKRLRSNKNSQTSSRTPTGKKSSSQTHRPLIRKENYFKHFLSNVWLFSDV